MEYASGEMHVVDADGNLSAPLAGLPEISHEGWAGLFDLTLDPDFASNRRIYFSYTAPGVDRRFTEYSPCCTRATLNRNALRVEDVEVIADGNAQQELLFAADGKLLASGAANSGDGQDLQSHMGKLLRLDADGAIPRDNPVLGDARSPSAIYSLGHRDISGIAIHPETGAIWITRAWCPWR